MLTAWILFSLLVSSLVAAAARATEAAAGELGAALRWGWAGGIAIAVGLSLLALTPTSFREMWAPAGNVGLSGAPGDSGLAVAGRVPTLLIEPLLLGSTGEVLRRLDPLVAGLWLLAVLVLGSRFVLAHLRLGRERRRWTPTPVDDGEVLISEDVGPGVSGFIRMDIVLPRWCLRLPEPDRSLVLAHELEHCRARDPLLVAGGRLVALLAPWNLPVRWMVSRLRSAVEIDCDARVIRDRVGLRRRYGHLLLLVGARGSAPRARLQSFSPSPSTLDRRIRMLTRQRSRFAHPRALLLGLLGASLLFAACLVPGPDDPESATGPESARSEATDDAVAPAFGPAPSEPEFTPHDTRPRVLNPEATAERLAHAYPSSLRDQGIGGTVILHVHVDASGEVRSVVPAETSGEPRLDDAARRVAEGLRFTPALNRDHPVPVWIQIPIRFDPDA